MRVRERSVKKSLSERSRGCKSLHRTPHENYPHPSSLSAQGMEITGIISTFIRLQAEDAQPAPQMYSP